MVVPPYSMRQGSFIWDILRLSCSPRCGPNDGPVWTCHWLRKAWSQTSCLTRPMRLLPSLIERNTCWFQLQICGTQPLSPCNPNPFPSGIFASATLDHNQQDSLLPLQCRRHFHTFNTLSILYSFLFHPIPLIFFGWYWPPFQPQLIVTSVKALISKFLWSFRGVKVQTKAPGGGLIDQHQSRSLASESIISRYFKHEFEHARVG